MSVFLPTIIEFLVLGLIVYGFLNEEVFVSFERRIILAFRRKRLKVLHGIGNSAAKKHCV